jgi:hypothetical protein
MSGGGQPAPDLPCRAARPVGGSSDQGEAENSHGGRHWQEESS